MLNEYLPVVVIMIFASGFVISMLLVSIFVGQRKYTEVKDDPFECGTIPSGNANNRLSVKFFLVAMVFILFDIEIVYMYPWAVELQKLGWAGFWAMISFVTVLVVGLAYVWRRGVLDWS